MFRLSRYFRPHRDRRPPCQYFRHHPHPDHALYALYGNLSWLNCLVCPMSRSNFRKLIWYPKYIQFPGNLYNASYGKRPVTGNSGDFVEAVFWLEIYRIFSNAFRQAPAGKHRKLEGIRRKKSENFPARIVLPCSSDIWCFLAGYGDFPASFLQDPARSGDRNHRPGVLELIK